MSKRQPDAQSVLVTGGAGYIGSHACKALAGAGFKPIAFDNLVNGHRWAVKWGPLEEGDILDRPRLTEVVKSYQPFSIIHFAAFAYVGESMTNPAKYYRNNVEGTLNLLDVMRNNGIAKMVFSSSCATYGVPLSLPINEDAPQSPINPYGASKLMIERVLADYQAAYGISSVSLRYFNAAGADADCEIGEAHDPETHLVPLVLDAAAGLRPEVTIFGNNYPTPDGTCIRDYIHVDDLVDAHVTALRALDNGRLDRAYNLGLGEGVSVAEVVATAEKVTGRRVPAVIAAPRAGDPPALVADPSRAKAELGFVARSSRIEEIVRSAWNWHQVLHGSAKRWGSAVLRPPRKIEADGVREVGD